MSNDLPQGGKLDLESVDPDRRKALQRLGQFAVYVSPAMTVLLKGEPADAHHNRRHTRRQRRRCRRRPWLPFCSQF